MSNLENRVLDGIHASVSWIPEAVMPAVEGGVKGFLAPFFAASALTKPWRTPYGFGGKLGYYAGLAADLAGHGIIAKGALLGGINWWYLGPLISTNAINFSSRGSFSLVNIRVSEFKCYEDDDW